MTYNLTINDTELTLECNESGFVRFSSRNFGQRGDKGTWARYDALRHSSDCNPVK